MTLYTDYEDAAYSPCGIPYVHGKEIPNFERLFLQGKEFYEQSGIDIHYQTTVESIDVARHEVRVVGEGAVGWDRLVIATGSTTPTRRSPAPTSRASTTPRTSGGPWSGTRPGYGKTAVVFDVAPLAWR